MTGSKKYSPGDCFSLNMGDNCERVCQIVDIMDDEADAYIVVELTNWVDESDEFDVQYVYNTANDLDEDGWLPCDKEVFREIAFHIQEKMKELMSH